MSKIELLNELFKVWRQKTVFKPDGQRGQFIPDGIICLDEYEKASLKIMFVLKDVDDQSPEFYYERGVCDEVIKSTNSGNTWNPIVEWAYALITGDPTYKYAGNLQKEPLYKIAIMNLKKASGIKSISKDELIKFVKDNKEQPEIISEIRICDPDIIITCGRDVFDVIKEVVCENNCEIKKHIDFSSKMKTYGKCIDIASCVGCNKPVWVVEYRHPNRVTRQGTREEHYENMLEIRKRILYG